MRDDFNRNYDRAKSLMAGPGFGHPGLTMQETINRMAREGVDKQDAYFAAVAARLDLKEEGIKVRSASEEARQAKQAAQLPLQIQTENHKGYSLIMGGGEIGEVAQALNSQMVRRMPHPQQVTRLRGAVKAFSFHWSNAQASWDVISIKDFPWSLDGAEFLVFVGPKAISPVGKLWTLNEMRYVAQKLNPHPGYARSSESGRRSLSAITRLTRRYLTNRGQT